MHDYITGIQQVGIGVSDAEGAMHSYKKQFGMDVLIFDDYADAQLMTQYTGNKVHKRRAILTLNMIGGGGFEIWQYLNREPQAAQKKIRFGDIGIFAPKIKCLDIKRAFDECKKKDDRIKLLQNSNGAQNFWIQDEFNNYFQVIEAQDSFSKTAHPLGGVCGAVIGVSDIDKAVAFYKLLLGDCTEIYNKVEKIKSLTDHEEQQYHRVLIRKNTNDKGAFGKLLGGIEIELVQVLNRIPVPIFQDRYWGDLGFIHLCLDVIDMDSLKNHMQANKFPFSVDSNNSFAMENAAGRFCYIEDPDGTLIELVETHKVPVLKKIGWYFNLKRRGLVKPLPKWMVKMLSLSKVK